MDELKAGSKIIVEVRADRWGDYDINSDPRPVLGTIIAIVKGWASVKVIFDQWDKDYTVPTSRITLATPERIMELNLAGVELNADL